MAGAPAGSVLDLGYTAGTAAGGRFAGHVCVVALATNLCWSELDATGSTHRYRSHLHWNSHNSASAASGGLYGSTKPIRNNARPGLVNLIIILAFGGITVISVSNARWGNESTTSTY